METVLLVVVCRFCVAAVYPNISIRQAGVMTGLFGIAIPGLGAAVAGLVLRQQLPLPFWQITLGWWSSHAVGACLFGPPILLISFRELERLGRRRYLIINAATCIAGLAACYLTIRYVRFPFVSIGLFLLLASFRLGAFGTSLLSLVFGLLITQLWLIDIRPLGLDPAASMTAPLLGLPVIALLATVMPPIAVGVGSDARRAAARALRESEARYRLVVEDQSEFISLAGLEGELKFVNTAYAELFGREPGDMLGTSLYDHVPPEERAQLHQHLERVVRSPDPISSENWMVAADGGLRWVAWTNRAIRDADGHVTGIHSVGRDKTQRRAAEQALRESQSFLARTGAAAGVGGWELHLPTGKLTWSDETRRLHDVGADFVPTVENALGFYTEHSRAVVQRALHEATVHATPWDLELELVSATGRVFWARATGTVEFENGTATRLVGAFQDITETRRLQRELADSYELVRVTLDSIGDAVITTDPEGRVQWLNPVAEAMTGWTKDEARSQPLARVFNIVHAESRQPNINPVEICLAEGRTVGLQSQSTLISRTGAEFGIEDSTSPIRNAEGEILGAVLVFHDVTEQRRMSHEMSHRATHDALTGLVNRAEFELRLSRLLAGLTLEGSAHVLMFIDLDEFKVVNDACGHSAGDQLLRQLSVLLQGCMRGRDTLARLGGDEFGVLLENCGIEQGQMIAQKICDQMETYRFAHDGRRYRIGTSIGIVPVDLRWGSSAAVMQAADSCCYAAKDAGRNRVHLWVESDGALELRRGEMQWVNRLEAAMDENRFALFAQLIEPIAGPGGSLHCEVLLRLIDDEGALIPPGAFLPSAERFHLAARIDRWVVRHVFSHLEAAETRMDQIATISINVSGQSLGDRAFHRDLIRMLRSAAFDVRKVCFEITETAAITHLGDARLFIEEVRSLGVRIALDDFGAGASSFGYLRTLPVDYIKIDGQFITGLLDDPLDHAAVRCFCEVAKVVGVKTIAEFVERADIRAALEAIGVDYAQGYLLHRPEPFLQLLSRPARVGTPMPA
jgi:diguanylate cyclase (GGDEF)-like protein/PAS domain S-box-containing protein